MAIKSNDVAHTHRKIHEHHEDIIPGKQKKYCDPNGGILTCK